MRPTLALRLVVLVVFLTQLLPATPAPAASPDASVTPVSSAVPTATTVAPPTATAASNPTTTPTPVPTSAKPPEPPIRPPRPGATPTPGASGTAKLAPKRQASPRPLAGVAYQSGDVFAGVGAGMIKHFSSSGALRDTLDTGTGCQDDLGMAFDSTGSLYAAANYTPCSPPNSYVVKFDNQGSLVPPTPFFDGTTFPFSQIADPIVVDTHNHVFVGMFDGPNILEFDTQGNLTTTFTITADQYAGATGMALGPDGCTLYYTSDSLLVRAFNVCTNTQLATFATLPSTTGAFAYAVQARPNGEALVSTDSAIYRLSASGVVVGTVGLPAGETSTFYALALDPDNASFWTAEYGSGNVYEFDIQSGAQKATFPAGIVACCVLSLAVFGQVSGGLPSQPAPPGTNTSPPLINSTTSNDPVNTLSGSYTYSHSDLAIPGRGPSPVILRSYNTVDTRVGPFGPGWTFNYGMHLSSPGDGTQDVILDGPQGRSDRYVFQTSTGTYTPPPAVYTTLTKNGDGTYTATLQDQMTWTFNAIGLLTKIADRYANASTLTYNGGNQLIGVSDPAGRGSLTFGYANGNLTSVVDWASPARSMQYGYDSNTPPRLHTVTDRNGKGTTFGYDGTTSRLTTITDANNHTAVTMTYGAQGRVQTQKDARGLTTGQQTTFSYVTNGDGTQTTTVTSPTTSFDGTAPTTADTYDTLGRVIKRVSHPSASETYTEQYGYDANANRTSFTDARGNATTYCYDVDYTGAVLPTSHGNLTRTISPPPAGGQNPLVSLVKYDAKNNLLETVAPKGVSNGASVACTTNLSSSVNALFATGLTYDTGGVFLLSTTRRFTDPDLGQQTAVTTFEYTDGANPGLPTWITPPRGNTGGSPDHSYAVSLTYSASGSQAGMLQQGKDAMGDTTTSTYDPVGRRLTMVDPNGNAAGGVPADHTWSYQYDNEDRLTQASAPAPAHGGSAVVTQSQYDPVGNRTVVIDANGQVTKYLYDERDQLKEVDQSPNPWTDPNATPNPLFKTTYVYDNLGNLSRMTRAAGDSQNERATDYAYDGLNRTRTETQYPSWPTTSPTLVTSTVYDGNGNATRVTKPDTTSLNYTYDALNRLLTRDNPGVTYAYDANSNRSSMVDPTGTTTYAYDELDRLTSVTSPGSVVVGDRYDLDANRRKVLYPDSTAVTSTFDKADRLQSMQDWASRTTSYGYFPDGNLQTTVNVNGTTATMTEDHAQRLTQVWNQTSGGATISQHAYSLDNVGNRTQLQETLAQLPPLGSTSSTLTYGLDRLYRLTSASQPTGLTNTYTYDPVGNRLTATGSLGLTYDKADRIATSQYTTDPNGNLTQGPLAIYQYDQANRLTSGQVGNQTDASTYDGDGNRATTHAVGPGTDDTITSVYDVARSLPTVLQPTEQMPRATTSAMARVDTRCAPEPMRRRAVNRAIVERCSVGAPP